MSTLKVDSIQPYAASNVSVPAKLGVDNSSGNAEIVVDSTSGGEEKVQLNSNFWGEYYGGAWFRNPGIKTANIFLGEAANTALELNTFSGSYDNFYSAKVDGTGVKFQDWNPAGGYARRTWLEVPQMGDVAINTNVNVTGVSKQTFNAPSVGNGNELVRVNNASISGKSYSNVVLQFADYSGFGSNFEDYFSIEYYDSFGYNYGSEFDVNGKETRLSTTASGSMQVAEVKTTDNYDGTSQLTLNALHVVVPQLGNYADDTAAAAGGVKVNGLYRSGSQVMVRVS